MIVVTFCILLIFLAISDGYCNGRCGFLSCKYSRVAPLNILKRDKESFRGGLNKERRSRGKGDRSNVVAQKKVARLLRDELSDIITTADIKVSNYPPLLLLAGVSIPDVEFSSDFSYAKVHVSVTGNSVEKRQIYVWLCNNIGQIRHSLSQRLKRLRRIPDIRFSLVDTSSRYYLSQTMEDASFLPGDRNIADDTYENDEDFIFLEEDADDNGSDEGDSEFW